MSGRADAVLLVDDDPIMQAVMASLLRKQRPMSVHHASNGLEAFQQIEALGGRLSLMVCDLNMPQCDGIDLIERLGARRCRMPIIFVTSARASVVAAAKLRASALGFDVVGALPKPVDAVQFADCVRQAIAA